METLKRPRTPLGWSKCLGWEDVSAAAQMLRLSLLFQTEEKENLEHHLLSFQGHLEEGQVNEGRTRLILQHRRQTDTQLGISKSGAEDGWGIFNFIGLRALA